MIPYSSFCIFERHLLKPILLDWADDADREEGEDCDEDDDAKDDNNASLRFISTSNSFFEIPRSEHMRLVKWQFLLNESEPEEFLKKTGRTRVPAGVPEGAPSDGTYGSAISTMRRTS